MSNDIKDIIERLAILEGRVTPTTVKHGLNPQQQSVKQLPALFKPKDISPTLSKPPYQKHPMDGWLVGEEEETDEAVVLSKDLAIHDPEGERFANPDAEADVNVAAKWKEVNKLGGVAPTPGWAAGYPKTDNKNVNVNTTGSGATAQAAASNGTDNSVKSQPEKDMGPADVVKALPGMKEGNIPDRIPSTLDVINYKDYVRQMKSEFGDEWTPDPEPMKPYDTKNLGPVKYSQPPVEEELSKMLKRAGVKHTVKEVAPEEQGGSTGGSVEAGTIPHDDINLDADDIPWHASGTLPGEPPALSEAKVEEEKLLDKVRKSLNDYLASVDDKKKDTDIKEKKKDDRDLGKKDKGDKDLLPKHIDEDLVPQTTPPPSPEVNPTYGGGNPTSESIEIGNGRVFEIHGDKHTGFEIRHGNRALKSKFKTLDEARMAIEMFKARSRCHDESADYIEEK